MVEHHGHDFESCGFTWNGDWQFSAGMGAASAADERAWTRDEIADLENLLDFDRDPLVEMREATGAPVTISIDNLMDFTGSTSCDNIELNLLQIDNDEELFRHTVRHEIMHRLGAGHVGEDDSHDGFPPTMACDALDLSPGYATRDDRSYLQWLLGDIPERQFNSNIGFEAGSADHFVNSGLSSFGVTTNSSVAYAGTRYARFSPGPDGFMYVLTRILNGNNAYVAYRTVVTARRLSGALGSFRPELWYRTVNYPRWNTSAGCPFDHGVTNPNGPTTTGSWKLLATRSDTTLSTAWLTRATSWRDPLGARGYDFRGSVHASSDDDVLIDNLRLESSAP